MTKGPGRAAVSAIAGTFQTTTGNGNQKSFSAKRLTDGEQVAGIPGYTALTGYTALVSSTALVAHAQ